MSDKNTGAMTSRKYFPALLLRFKESDDWGEELEMAEVVSIGVSPAVKIFVGFGIELCVIEPGLAPKAVL